MIDRKTAETLVSLISNEKEQLRNIHKTFCAALDANSRMFSMTSLAFLLQFSLLSTNQQIVALWILDRETRNLHTNDNPFLNLFKNLFERKNENALIVNQLIWSILNKDFTTVDAISNKTIAQITNPKFIFSKNSPETCKQEPFIKSPPPVFAVEEENSNPEYSETEILVKILTSDILFNEPKAGPDLDAPPLLDIQKEELENIQTIDVNFVFDDNEKRMIYEPIESIIGRMDKDKLKKRERDIVVDAVKKNKGLVSFLFNESCESIQRTQRFIETNMSCAKKLYRCLAEVDQTIFDMMLNFQINSNSLEIIEDVILNGVFPSNFVESFIDVTLEKIRKTKDKETRDSNAADLCRMMVNMHLNKVQFSDYVICELRDFCEEKNYQSIKESQDLLALIADE